MRAIIVAVVALAGCQRTQEETAAANQPPPAPPRAPNGTERGDCRPDHTCDQGLLCLSDLCVRPPPADCVAVAEVIASYELGNYAPRDKRTAMLADKRALCEREHVTKDEQKCIDDAKDKYAVAACVPKLYPEMIADAQNAAGDCDKIVVKMRDALRAQMTGGNDPQMQRIMEQASNAIRVSCREDHWPAALRQCLISAPATTDGMRSCESQMPSGLQERIARRMQ